MLAWRIIYGNLDTFDSSQGGPEDAPSLNAQWIILSVDNHPGYAHLKGSDWYFYLEDEGWYGADLPGLLDHMMHQAHRIQAVLMGRTIPNEHWRQVKSLAENDSDFVGE